MIYPLQFEPILVERVWGGDRLARYGKAVAPGQHIGESWEISDRDKEQSMVRYGPHRGKTLRQLIELLGVQLLGTNCVKPGSSGGIPRFPLLIKLLDARERLSLQVHPPAHVAPKLGGEPKTEMWYVLEADPHAHLIAGLKRGVNGADVVRALEEHKDSLAGPIPVFDACVHRFPVAAGESFFVPSGRMHAIDAGLVLIEVQQNSDTTYRVYDWGRVGLDGKPRDLHIPQSLESIDFQDIAPAKQRPRVEYMGVNGCWRLVECAEFCVHKLTLRNAWTDRTDGSSFHIIAGAGGQVGVLTQDGQQVILNPGEFILMPAALGYYTLTPVTEGAVALKTFVPGEKK
jgi:mannose-6-phosphate isomerase